MSDHENTTQLSDDDVRATIKQMLTEIDIASTSMREIRRILQGKVGAGFNVEERKDFVKETVEHFLINQDDDEEVDDETHMDVDGHTEGGEGSAVVAKKKGGGFNKPLVLSDELAEFMDTKIASRTEVTKRIWEYIKGNDLQNPANRREILCDDKLEKLMKRKRVNMFKMTQILNPMMKRAQDLQANCLSDPEEDEEEDQKKKKKSNKRKASDTAEINVKLEDSKRIKTENVKSSSKNSAHSHSTSSKKVSSSSATVSDPAKDVAKKLKKPVKIISTEADNNEDSGDKEKKPAGKGGFGNITVHADLLAALGETEISTRPQLVKKMWEYIRSQNLQNPADKREIVLDEALKQIFKVKTFTAFSMNKYLSDVVKKV